MKVKSDKVTMAATRAMAYWLIEDAKTNIRNKVGVNLTNQLRDLLYNENTVVEVSKIIDNGGDHVDVFFYIAQEREYPTITVFGDAHIFQHTVKNYKDTGRILYDFISDSTLEHTKLSNRAVWWKPLAQVFKEEYIEFTEIEYKKIKPWLDLVEFEDKLKEHHAFIPSEGFFSVEAQRQLELNGLI